LDHSLVVIRGIVLTVLAFGLMVIVHELGHFLAAKLIGVRVERFSFGMGPKLFGKRLGETEYMVSALPIGGYVKLAGGDEGEEATGAPDEFVSKPPGQRALVLAAGPVFSILFGLPVFLAMFLVGVRTALPKVSHVVIGGPAWQAGLCYGDRVVRLGDREIHDFDELRLAALETPADRPVTLVIERDGKQVELSVVRPRAKQELGIYCSFIATKVRAVVPGSPAEKAGLKPNDELVSVDGHRLRGWSDFRRRVLASPGRPIELGIRRNGKPLTLTATPEPQEVPDPPFRVTIPAQVGFVRPGFPADAKIKAGDVILAANGKQVRDWWELEDAVAEGPSRAVLEIERQKAKLRIEVDLRPGQRLTDTLGIAPRPVYVVTEVRGATNPPLRPGDELVKIGRQDVERSLLHGALYTPLDDILTAIARAGRVTVRRGKDEIEVTFEPGKRTVGMLGVEQQVVSAFVQRSLPGAIVPAARETARAAALVYVVLKKLFSGDLARDSVAGPVGILQATYASAQQGLARLLRLIGLITVNIGVLNLLPIPPLDGGRLVLVGYEKVRGRQPNRKVIEAILTVGFVLLLGLILFATFNDIQRLLSF